MHIIKDDTTATAFRNALMQFLNEYGLEATAILSLARRTELVVYEPEEVVLKQGALDEFVYFLVRGNIVISLEQQGRVEALGERSAVTLLGEISFFNGTPATATVSVRKDAQGTFLRLSYEQFTDVIDQYPQVKPALARIGEMRVIAQMDGFISFTRFMELIGRKRDRLAVNRALFQHLEDTITMRLLPRLGEASRVLDVGDGPGIVAEVIREHKRDWEANLFLQATHLEEAILNPLQSYRSDFSRAAYLRERFDAIVALQLFEYVQDEEVEEQFQRAAGLLLPGGLLLVIRLRVVDVIGGAGKLDTSLFFKDLEGIVRRLWPGVIDDESLINVSFVDADIDPMMEWNPRFCDAVVERQLTPPPEEQGMERVLLDVLLEQARRREFNPEAVNFHWLIWHASHHGLVLEDSAQNPEIGFYYLLLRLDAAAAAG